MVFLIHTDRQTFVTCDYLSRGRNGPLVRPAGRPATVHFPATDRPQLNCDPSESHSAPTYGAIQMWSPELTLRKHCLTFRKMNARGASKRRQPVTQWQTQRRHIRNIRAAAGSAVGTRWSICSPCCGPLRCSQLTQGLLHSPGRHSATDYNCRSADTPDGKKPCKTISLAATTVTTNAYVNK